MLVRIICRNKERTDAYAEVIKSYKILKGTDTIMYVDYKNGCHFGLLSEIVSNPEIIKECIKGTLYKIKLPEGER